MRFGAYCLLTLAAVIGLSTLTIKSGSTIVPANSAPLERTVPSPRMAQNTTTPRTVFVYLFQWRWEDVAQECEAVLGPKGFAAVHVTPPQEHRLVAGHPWYERYQVVGYQLESRGGTRAQFAEMVDRCKRAGVDVYVDAVINHTTGVLEPGQSEVGSAGSRFLRYDYPGTYSAADFHYCGRNGNDDIQNYQDRSEVQNCELVNLADLKTEAPYVRDRLAAYLNDLVQLGVAGLRIDAAKHIATNDIQAILRQVNGNPYIFQEVIEGINEPIRSSEYFQNGDVTEFQYARAINRVFQQEKLAYLENFGEAWGFMPSDKAIVFVDNHDTQRGDATVLTYKQRDLYQLATVFMLAYPYGYPELQSSFEFQTFDQGPPTTATGAIQPVGVGQDSNCGKDWVCEHRWPAIVNMVAFRNQTAGNFFVSDWWTNGNNQIAFGRGDAGFVVINRETTPLERQFQTSLAPGRYCNIITGERSSDGSRCTGDIVTVDSNRRVTIRVEPLQAVALHRGARL